MLFVVLALGVLAVALVAAQKESANARKRSEERLVPVRVRTSHNRIERRRVR